MASRLAGDAKGPLLPDVKGLVHEGDPTLGAVEVLLMKPQERRLHVVPCDDLLAAGTDHSNLFQVVWRAQCLPLVFVKPLIQGFAAFLCAGSVGVSRPKERQK